MIINDMYITAEVIDILLKLQEESGLLHEITDVGSDYMITCPRHSGGQERNASCGVLKEDKIKEDGRVIPAGTVHCYTCNYVTDIVGLVTQVKGYQTAHQGLQWIIQTFMTNNMEKQERPALQLNISRETPMSRVNHIATDIVNKNYLEFLKSDLAKNYMASRGISLPTCREFKIGYNPYTKSIMIPVTQDNQVIFYKERYIDKRGFKNQKGVSKGDYIFGLDKAIQNYKKDSNLKVWICESEIDALTVYERGDTAIAIMGSQISDTQIELLNNSPIRNLIDGLDRDKAGRLGSRYLRDKTVPLGFRHYITNWEGINKKDINELSTKEYQIIKNRLK